jgi:hypothetical protein
VHKLKDAPAPGTGTAHSVADSVSYLHAMMDADMDTNYSEFAYAAASDSDSSKEMHKPRGCDRKSKPCHGRHKKDKKGAKKQHENLSRTKKVLIKINCIEKCLLDPDPI